MCVNAKSYFFRPVCAVSESSSLTPQAGLCKVPASPIINGLRGNAGLEVWDRADSAQFPSGTFRLDVNTRDITLKLILKNTLSCCKCLGN